MTLTRNNNQNSRHCQIGTLNRLISEELMRASEHSMVPTKKHQRREAPFVRGIVSRLAQEGYYVESEVPVRSRTNQTKGRVDLALNRRKTFVEVSLGVGEKTQTFNPSQNTPEFAKLCNLDGTRVLCLAHWLRDPRYLLPIESLRERYIKCLAELPATGTGLVTVVYATPFGWSQFKISLNKRHVLPAINQHPKTLCLPAPARKH
ncbi:hypothetical protein [Ferrimonas marina]|uniref:Uncharacterized protein n=1 Tax=Ferrimonas marina TaxID=299255 RepID=A0A1M5U6A0_9GAMM|nr:hypothetical protein [Ferrimonas marina]SHH58421.1 hypothetical protein SAMN02745129_2423 [Ferrimonas marina]